jgi:NAD-dependent deacetylase
MFMSIEKLKSIIEDSNNIVFFGGAGVSTESDIPDFRSSTGLYKASNNFEYPVETMLSHSFFVKYPKEFYEFYKSKMIYKSAKPNTAHFALVKLEKLGKLKAVITQNIDGLHQAAGSENVLELHGSVHRNYCTHCNNFFHLEYILNSSIVPKCNICESIIKPDVVLYEENLDIDVLNRAASYIKNSEVLIIGGTSLNVYPAASLIKYFNGKKLILINKSSTSFDSQADLVIHENIGETLKNIL